MRVEKIINGQTGSLLKGATYGVLVAIGWTILNLILISMLIVKEVIRFELIGYGVLYILISAAYLCGKISYMKNGNKRILVCIYAAGMYYFALIAINVLCFGGYFAGSMETLLCVLGGLGLSLLAAGGKNKNHYKRIHKMKRA